MPRKYLKPFLLLALTFLGFLIMCHFWAIAFRPEIQEKPFVYADEILDALAESRNVSFSSDNLPVITKDVDYSEGPEASWYPKGESPLLSELVAEGKLPPVAERVGKEPLVMEGVEGLGTYGGTWFRVASSMGDIGALANRLSAATLVRWSPLGYPIRPHIAKSWEASEDKSEWTFHLRKGMKWSDGHPFTVDDIMYWQHQEELLNPTRSGWMRLNGELGSIQKIDDHTVKFIFPEPYGNFLEVLASNIFPYAPRHYLSQFHPEDGDQDLIREQMRARGLTSARALYNNLLMIRNPEMPRLWPWIYRTHRSSPPDSFVRNPYYWAVDTEGNQLPYVDRIHFEVKAQALIPVSAASGEVTMQARNIRYEDYTLLMENRQANDYEVYHWFNAVRSAWALWPNLNRRVVEGDPASAMKAELLQEKTFRQALSVAIDRQKVIDAFYNGYGEPAQIAPGRESPFHHEGLLRSYTQYDPEMANRKLDELGLTQRDKDRMRTFPDGSRMSWYIDFTSFTGEGPAQFVVDDWRAVGIRAIHRERTRPLFSAEKVGLLHDFTVWTGESEFNPMVEPRSFVAVNTESHYAPAYGMWYQRGGLHGAPDADPAFEPPPGSAIREGQELFTKAVATRDLEGQVAIFNEIFDIAAENVWSISIATPPPQLVVVKNGFRNVPRNALSGYSYATPANAGIETFYFENPVESPGAIAQIKREMTTITLPSDIRSALDPGSTNLTTLIWNLCLGISVLVIILAGVKHPYIGRRLLVMIPTVFIISLITFYIIQLPPGDYVETRILQLQMDGNQSAIEEVERLRVDFRLDDPIWKQYAHWLGLPWFATFESADKGLLQGHMGRSMETQRSVNAMVGDRLILTVLVSLGTILFTWVIALPIGIYSAVRQYTVGDYILSFIGFIGMCIPNFLLAIVLMYWSGKYLGINVTGLFSPEYAADPTWTWGKIMDLMKHIWVPIIVIATAGTAGMIRVMRGNLLDELRKPYVTTAMAKGVRPFRLLIKYPVRLALNPFISGIGSIFPQLVSGGAIVAIVLSLPMIGPLLLDGLMTQDVYLAGSMLMVLSLLGVFGTLVSDLLLLWLDPRIRMEGGSR